MASSWIEVADTAIKIGLGSLITALSGYLIIYTTHKHEVKKDQKHNFYALQKERKIVYVNFLALSHALVQKHLMTSSTCDTEEYNEYLRCYSEVQIISPDEMRLAAHKVLSSVNEFIVSNKTNPEYDLIKKMRKAVNDNSGYFEKLAQLDVTKMYVQEKT